MPYGRLEVYWPDGRLEIFMLETDTVSVGRAEGNTITLDTETISRYHFSIVHEGEQVTITDLDSANGTFVDSIALKSNEPHVLEDVEEIMLGSLRIIFRMVDDSPTESMQADLDTTQRYEHKETQIRVELDYSELEVWPSASSSAELSITNLAKETRAFSIQVSGMPSGWLRLTRPEIELDQNETAYILLNIKPPRRPNTVPQHYKVSIEVTPIEEPEAVFNATLDVEIKSYSGFGMAIGHQADDGEPMPVYLHNQGSGVLQVTLRAYDKQNALNFHLPNTALELQAGQRLRVDLGIEAKNPSMIGQVKHYPFIVEVNSHGSSGFTAATNGKVGITPRIPLWGVISGAGIAIAALIIAFLAISNSFSPREPVINNIVFNENQLEQGTTLEITIDSENTASFDILIGGDVYQEEADGDSTIISVDTSGYEGEVGIEVIARNGEESISEQAQVVIYVPIAEGTFFVEPEQLVRYTVNTLAISWDIPGAIFVRISGLSEFTNNRLQPSAEYPATHTLEGIGGIPTEALELTLYAEDQAGNSIEMSLIEPVIDPHCIALSETVLLEGPDERYQQVATVSQNATVIVIAQDADAGWLRVLLPGDVRGWGNRNLFNCADTFDIVNLRTEFNIPELPTEVPTLAPSPIPPSEATEEADS